MLSLFFLSSFPAITYAKGEILFVETDVGIDMDDSWVASLLTKQDKFDAVYFIPNMAAKKDQENQFQLIDQLISTVALNHTGTKFEILKSIDSHSPDPQYIKSSTSLSVDQRIRFDNRVDLKTKIKQLNLDRTNEDFYYLSIAPPINLADLIQNVKDIEKNIHLVAMLGQLPGTSRAEHNAKISPAATKTVLEATYRTSHFIPIDTSRIFKIEGWIYKNLLEIPAYSEGALMNQYQRWCKKFPYMNRFYQGLDPYTSSSCLFDVVALYFLLNPKSEIFHWAEERYGVNNLGIIEENSTYPQHFWHTSWTTDEEVVVNILSEWVVFRYLFF